MTLYRRLMFAITALMALLMAGNLFLSVYNSRSYNFEQMQVHAQDAATSLGMSLTHAADSEDESQIQTFINAMFDRGYFQSISYRDFNGTLKVQRQISDEPQSVPGWFVRTVRLPPTLGSAEVMSGWRRLGVVTVVSHPGYAYREMWQVLIEQFWLFIFATVLSYALAGAGLRVILRPLRGLQRQADSVCRREFEIQQNLPSTPELRSVVVAMNRMVERLQSTFNEQVELSETLYREAHLDDLTGLPTRADFQLRLYSFINSESGGCPAALLLIQIGGLDDFNRVRGRVDGDACLRDVADLLRDHYSALADCFTGRLSGTHFAVFLPYMELHESRQNLEDLRRKLLSLHWLGEAECLQLSLGATHTGSVKLGHQLFQEADLALSQSQRNGKAECVWYESMPTGVARGSLQWRALIEAAMRENGVTFVLQPVFAAGSGEILQHEILCRLQTSGEQLTAGVIVPMAERHGLAVKLDRHVLERVAECRQLPSSGRLTMNLSPRTLRDESFFDWLLDFLEQRPQLARRLVFELPESCLVNQAARISQWSERLSELGTAVSLDQFGSGASMFRHLYSLSLLTVKMERRFTQGAEDDPDCQFYIRTLLQIAHSCDISLLADGIESESQWQALKSLGVDGGQGYYLGVPEPV